MGFVRPRVRGIVVGPGSGSPLCSLEVKSMRISILNDHATTYPSPDQPPRALVPAARASDLVAALPPGTRSPAERYVAGLAPGSRRAQAAALVRLARLLGADDPRAVAWWKLTPELIDALRAQLADQAAPATVNRVLSALRGTLHAAWRAGLMDAATYQAARAVRGARGSRLPRGRAVGTEEWRRLFREIGHAPSPIRERDAALVALAYAGGFRRAELVALDLADYDAEAGRLRVIGKGNKERAVFISNGARDALHAWLRVRGRDARPAAVARRPPRARAVPAAHRADGVRPPPPPRGARRRRGLLAA